LNRVDLRRRLERVRREERGITLIEVLITAVILNVVLFAILGLLDVSARAVPKDMERAAAIQESQTGLYRMTRELRQAHEIVSGGTHAITVNVFVAGAPTQVTYDCAAPHPTDPDYRRCTRQVGAAGVPELVIDRVVNHRLVDGSPREVFEYYDENVLVAPAAARYVDATVIVPGRGDRRQAGDYEHEIVLADGLYMRNIPDLP